MFRRTFQSLSIKQPIFCPKGSSTRLTGYNMFCKVTKNERKSTPRRPLSIQKNISTKKSNNSRHDDQKPVNVPVTSWSKEMGRKWKMLSVVQQASWCAKAHTFNSLGFLPTTAARKKNPSCNSTDKNIGSEEQKEEEASITKKSKSFLPPLTSTTDVYHLFFSQMMKRKRKAFERCGMTHAERCSYISARWSKEDAKMNEIVNEFQQEMDLQKEKDAIKRKLLRRTQRKEQKNWNEAREKKE